jgi:hypothetical protein
MRAMLSLRPLASSALALLGFATTLGFARSARATEDMKVDTVMPVGKDLLVNVLTIKPTGVLVVEPLRNMHKGMGRMRIAANKIIIEAGGSISATGSGSIGVNGADGTAEVMGGGGNLPGKAGQPGGGGGYFGLGASGANETCVSIVGAEGGSAWAMPTAAKPFLGSAGGAANTAAAASAGGDGGGVIIIEAAEIQLDGSIESRGASPIAVSGVARGGGSGGFISILAAHITGSGSISARGGDGTAAPGNGGAILATNGGGGAGGVVLINARDVAQAIQDNIHVEGGLTGVCAMLGAAAGTKTVNVVDPQLCVDADQDGHLSSACAGDDCDDSDAKINPDIAEICNGIDDNCKGGTDEGDAICSAGRTCVDAVCIDSSDAGTDAGPTVDAGAPPDHITFESGCSFRGDGGGLGALATAALGAMALATRRRRANGAGR